MNVVRQSLLLVQWQLRRQSVYLPLLVLVQIIVSVATVVGYGLLVGDPSPQVALYLATGAPTITLISVGLVMTPQQLAMARTEGSLDWLRTLPVPRALFLASDVLVWTVLALPGMVMGVVVGVLRFHVTLSLAPWLVAATLLVSATSAAVGYAMASLLAPTVAQLMTQLLLFIVLLFSPVSFPADRLPEWLRTAHEFLPIEPMAQIVRAGLVQDQFTVPGRAVLVLCAWCVAAVAGACAALRRRA